MDPEDPRDPDLEQVDAAARAPLLEVGRISKPHGLGGEVVVDLVTNRTERLDPGTVLTTPTGLQLVVESSQPFVKRWIVSFQGVSDREAADRLRGKILLAEPVDDPDALWVDELVGSVAEDERAEFWALWSPYLPIPRAIYSSSKAGARSTRLPRRARIEEGGRRHPRRVDRMTRSDPPCE